MSTPICPYCGTSALSCMCDAQGMEAEGRDACGSGPPGRQPGAAERHAPNNRSTPESAPTGEALTDADITDAMIAAYLDANHAYWVAQDEIPPNAGKWRSGTAKEATRAGLRAALSTHPSAPVAPEWPPLPEVPEERRIFDNDVARTGDVRLAIAVSLRIWANAHPGGSYAAQCRIMANEVMKLHLAHPSAVQPVAPAGWKLVPVEPTRDMLAAGRVNMAYSVANAAQVWAAMCAATPSAEAQPTPKDAA